MKRPQHHSPSASGHARQLLRPRSLPDAAQGTGVAWLASCSVKPHAEEIPTGKRRHDTMAKKRGNNEGSITKRKNGLWMAQITVGRDPATGKPKRATFYGKTRQEVADKLTKALREQQQGTFVAPHKLTLGAFSICSGIHGHARGPSGSS